MFKKVIILSIVCFFSLTVITSLIKNSSRNLEKDILKLKRDVYLLEKQVSEAEIDFIYLSNPEQITKKILDFDKKKYTTFDHSRIFLSINHFLLHQTKDPNYLNIKVTKW